METSAEKKYEGAFSVSGHLKRMLMFISKTQSIFHIFQIYPIIEYRESGSRECALWHVAITLGKTLRLIGISASWDEDHQRELPGSEIACPQIIRADAWQETHPTTTSNRWCFLFFGNTTFSGSWVAKQRKLTFSWLLMNCMTALRVCYASNYCDNMPINMLLLHYSYSTRKMAEGCKKWVFSL